MLFLSFFFPPGQERRGLGSVRGNRPGNLRFRCNRLLIHIYALVMRSVRLFVLIDVIQFLTIAAEVDAAPLGIRKSGKSSVFSLFNLKGKSKFWSEDVIRGGKMPYISSLSSKNKTREDPFFDKQHRETHF